MRIPLSKPAVDRKFEKSSGASQLVSLDTGLVVDVFSHPSGIRPQECRYICYPKLDGGFECSVTCTF
jgi:hypothetical protein